jgi:hypothetical protein
VQAKGPGNITDEAGNTDTHVGWIAPFSHQCCQTTENKSAKDNQVFE